MSKECTVHTTYRVPSCPRCVEDALRESDPSGWWRKVVGAAYRRGYAAGQVSFNAKIAPAERDAYRRGIEWGSEALAEADAVLRRAEETE